MKPSMIVFFGGHFWGIFEGQIMAQESSAEVSKEGNTSPPNALNSGLGIILICPNGHVFFSIRIYLGSI